MGEMAEHDAEMYGSEFQDPKLQYLYWAKRKFDSSPRLNYMVAHKHPEFGVLTREWVDILIAQREQAIGRIQRLDDPNELIGQRVTVSLNGFETVRNYAQADIDFTMAVYNKLFGEIKEKNVSWNVDALRREARRLLEDADKAEGVPQDDMFKDGQVLTFAKKFQEGGRSYTYVAIKVAAVRVGEFWFTTAQRSGGLSGRLSWQALLEGIGLENLHTIEVLDMETAMPLKEWVKGVQEVVEQDDVNSRPAGADQ